MGTQQGAADAIGAPAREPNGGGTTAQAQGRTRQVAGQAREQVSRQLGSSVAGLKGPAASALGHYAEAVRQVGQQFREQNRGMAGLYAERAAGQMQRLSDYLQHTDVDELVDQLETVARRRPAVFLGTAFTVGVVAARFLKSSRRRQDDWTADRGATLGDSPLSTSGFDDIAGLAAGPGAAPGSGALNVADRVALGDVGRADADGSEIGSLRPPVTDDYRLR